MSDLNHECYLQFGIHEEEGKRYGSCEILSSAPNEWYWWPCFPGCLPDTDDVPNGPFETMEQCMEDAGVFPEKEIFKSVTRMYKYKEDNNA